MGVIYILIVQIIHFTHVHVTYTACHHTSTKLLKYTFSGTSLVVQWLRIHLPKEVTWVLSLVWELKILHASEQLSPCVQVLKPVLSGACTPQQEQPPQETRTWNEE